MVCVAAFPFGRARWRVRHLDSLNNKPQRTQLWWPGSFPGRFWQTPGCASQGFGFPPVPLCVRSTNHAEECLILEKWTCQESPINGCSSSAGFPSAFPAALLSSHFPQVSKTERALCHVPTHTNSSWGNSHGFLLSPANCS